MGIKATYIILSSTLTIVQTKPRCRCVTTEVSRAPYNSRSTLSGELDMLVKSHDDGRSRKHQVRDF
jgi:hypothetical protein